MKKKLSSNSFLKCIVYLAVIILVASVFIFPLLVKQQFVHVNLFMRSVFDSILSEDVSVTLQNNLTNQYEDLSGTEKSSLIQALEDFKFWFVLPSIDMFFPRGGWDHRIMLQRHGVCEGYIITNTYVEINDFLFYGNTRDLMAFFNNVKP